MNGLNRKFKIILIICLAIVGAFFVFSYASAQDTFGLQPVEQNIGLAATDIRTIIAKIIRAILGILGIIALAVVLYGGFVYMTAGGNEEKVSQAKKILINGIIGLIIILSAFAIVQFVINKLAGATGLVTEVPAACENIDYALSHPQICGADNDFPDDCAKNHFVVKSITPRTENTGMNNAVARAVFSRPVNYQSGNIKVFNGNNDITSEMDFALIGNDNVVEAKRNKCSGETCLENGNYKIEVSPDIKDKTGQPLEIETECGIFPSKAEFQIESSGEGFDMGNSQNYFLNFDGADDHVSLPNDIVPVSVIRSQGVTYSAWIKPAVVKPSVIVGQKPHAGYWDLSSGGLRIDNENKALMVAFDDAITAYVYVAGKNIIMADHFYFIAGTYNPVDKKMRIYVNGNLENTSPAIGSFSRLGANDANAIGINIHSVENNKYPFQGLMDEVHIYNRALTAEEIQNNYNKGKGEQGSSSEKGLQAGWHFNEGTGTTVNDFSGNNKNGTINGAVWQFMGTEMIKDEVPPVLSDLQITDKNGNAVEPGNLARGRTYYLKSDITDNSGAGYTHLNIISTSGVNLNEYDGPRIERGSDAPLSNPYKFSYPFFLPVNLKAGLYTLKLEAFDIDENSASKELSIVIISEHCQNGILDGDETGIDEGGSCGLTEGSECTQDYQCASQKCVDGKCVAFPIITSVDPWDGAPGNWVTILGKYFGSSPGQIDFGYDSNGDGKFDNEDIWTKAELASCQSGDVWNNNWVIAEVPQVAEGQYAVRLTNSVGYSVTSKDHRSVDSYFTLNNIKRPGLCSVKTLDDAKAGPPKIAIQAIGKNFGATQGGSTLNFGSKAKAGVQNWSDGLISAFVPNLQPSTVGVYVKVGNEKSNGVPFMILKEGEGTGPIISSIDPSSVTPKSYVTITGKGFGDTEGWVWIADSSANAKTCVGASPDTSICKKLNPELPAVCGDTWSDMQVIVEVPDITLKNYYLILKNTLGQSTAGDNDKLEIISGDPMPGICKLSPSSGPAPRPSSTPLKIYGINFGNSPVLYFWTKDSKPEDLNSWLSESATITGGHLETFIPVSDSGYSMQTGPIKVKVNNQLSNGAVYTVIDCRDKNTVKPGDNYHCCEKGADTGIWKPNSVSCEGEVREAGYVWRFATGIIPKLPYVVESCDGSTFPSPTPWTKWPQGKEACLNSSIAVKFSMGMDDSTLNSSNVKVYKCGTAQDGGIDCATKTQLPSADLALDYQSEVLTIRWAPPNLESNTWYHVELSDAITSLETKQELGVDTVLKQPLKKSRPCGTGTAYCFDFKTGSGNCVLTGAGINPSSHITNLLGMIQDTRFAFDLAHPFAPRPPAQPYYYYVWGKGSQECSVLNVDGQGWNWSSENATKATVVPAPSEPKYTDSRATATALQNATEGVQIKAVTTTAESTITATSTLFIDLSDPKVVEFWPNCGEACINAEIGVRFNQMMVTTTYAGGIKLYQCLDEFCANKNLVNNVLAVNSEFSNINTLRAYINDPYLEPNTWYLVELTADIKAIGAFDEDGVIKIGKSLEPFQWKFKTKSDNTPCQISTVQIIPSPFTAYFIGEKTKYMSFPHGSPDSCSPFGQSLNPWSFGWQWSTGNASVAEVTEFSTADKLKPYCDLLCLPAGSDIEKGKSIPICGNKEVEAGEDCDIGMTGEVATTSCGYNCLRPGNNDKGTGDKQCGNGNIDADKGEECEPVSISSIYSLSFDGGDDYVQAPSLGISSGSFSLEAWINSKLDEAGNYGTIMGYDGSHRILVQNSGLLLTQFGGNFFSQGKVKANEWSQIVYKYDSAANEEYFYINGEFDSKHTPTAVPVWNSAFKIGQYDLIHYKFHGLIDEARVYNKALSESDIKVHYNQGKGQKAKSGESGLLAGWHFDEGNGMLASDFSGNNKDGQLMGGTAWSNESPIVSESLSVTYCNANCTNKGSSTKEPGGDLDKSWCGSGSITAGEECEGEVGCSANCLHTGTALSQNWCDNKTGTKPKECDTAISICGNSIVESGEECEVTDTNKIKIHGGTGEITTSAEASKICTAKCLLQNICSETDIPISLRCNKDAQDCKDDCTLWGSSPNFSEPSLCGDGISGMGEYGFCEISLLADILGQNPVQVVTAIGNGEENPQTRRQETLINAKAVAFRNQKGAKEILTSDKQKTGQGNYYLQCGNTEFDGLKNGKYNDCVLPSGEAKINAFGVGANSCCYQRSERKEEYPQDGALGVCRNTYIEVKLNSEIDSQSLDKNIILVSGHEAGYNCASSTQPDQTAQINSLIARADIQPAGFWQKLWQTVKHFFAGLFGQKATATLYQPSSAVWCGSEKDVRAEMHYASPTSTISIYINNLLESNREYAVILKGGKNGIKDARGVGIKNKDSDDKLDDIWFFKTGNQVCKLQAIKVEPGSHWFKKPEATKNFQAITQSNNGQMIVTTTAYSWNWHWAPADNPVFAIPSTDNPEDANEDWVTIKSRNVEGTIKAVAQAKVNKDADSQNNQLGKVFTGTSDLLAKFCENPWPLPTGTGDNWVWNPFTDNTFNFSFNYCADAGKSGTTTDDLPFLEKFVFEKSEKFTVELKKCLLSQIACTADSGCLSPIYYNMPYDNSSLSPYIDECNHTKLPIEDLVKNNCKLYTSENNTFCIGKEYPPQYGGTYHSCTDDADCTITGETCVSIPGYSLWKVTDKCVVAGVKEEEKLNPTLTEDTLRRYLLFSDINDDVSGLQIFLNEKRLSAMAWFKEQFPNAPTPKQLTIAGYDAVQNGDNYYINGLNLVGDSLYNNIYLFSLNKGAQADSKKVLEQILQSLQFNINITNHGYCLNSGATLSANPNDINDQYICQTDFECLDINGNAKLGASGVCSNAKTKFFRDLRRFNDIDSMQAKLDNYFSSKLGKIDFKGNLKGGTFIPGFTLSVWPSWSNNLGKEVGTLPIDPINTWTACSDSGAEKQTCWKAVSSTLYCPAFSSIYEYEFVSSTASYKLHGPLEFFNINSNIVADRININKFVTDPWCQNNVVSPFGEKCGDGIVNTTKGERCEPPGMAAIGTYGQKTSVPGHCENWSTKECVNSEVDCGFYFTEKDKFYFSKNQSYCMASNDPVVNLTESEKDKGIFQLFDCGEFKECDRIGTYGGATEIQIGEQTYVLNFDGNNDYVEVPAAESLNFANKSFSWEMWLKKGVNSEYQMLIGQGKGDNISSANLVVGFRPNNEFTFAFWYNDLNTTVTFTDTSNWHHFAGTYDASTKARKIYHNGVEIASDTAKANYTGAGKLGIGGGVGGWANEYFKGGLYGVRIYNSVLSGTNVKAHYDKGRQHFSDALDSALAGLWYFDEGNGTQGTDYSGNNNLGNIYGASWVSMSYNGSSFADFLENNKSIFACQQDASMSLSECQGYFPQGGLGECDTLEKANKVCNTSCQWEYGICKSLNVCGNGKVETGETCDDGVLNGIYGHCAGPNSPGVEECKGLHSQFCGNGKIDTKDGKNLELCDWSVAGAIEAGWGLYNVEKNKSCSWDCQNYGSYCGDGVLQTSEGEECDDKNTANQDGCSAQCKKENIACRDQLPYFTTSTSQTFVYISKGKNSNNCEDANGKVIAQCAENTNGNEICRAYGLTCNKVEGYGSSGSGYNCVELGGQSPSCEQDLTWIKSNANLYRVVCNGVYNKIVYSCGNKIKEGNEECDDGNKVSGDGCSPSCMIEKQGCGNNIVETYDDENGAEVVEVCDMGVNNNGDKCEPSYGKSCVWCSADCKKKYTVDAVAYCGNGQINLISAGVYEACEKSAVEGYVVSSTPTGVGVEKKCTDKGKYECLNNCTKLVNNCVQCGQKATINGGVSPKIALLNPMIGKGIKWPYTYGDLEMVGLYTTSSAPSNLGYKTLISSFESGEQQILTGFSIESSPLCKEEYKVHFNYPDIFNFLYPPDGFINLLQFNNNWNEIKPYGDVFPYPVNGESNVVENELIMVPPMPDIDIRVVVRWTEKENAKGSFGGIFYSDDFYKVGNATTTISYSNYAMEENKPGGAPIICRKIYNIDKYWLPRNCSTDFNGINVHDQLGLKKTFTQSFTVDIGGNIYAANLKPIAFFVQNLNGFIAPYKNSKLQVEIYTYHPNQTKYSVYLPTQTFNIIDAAGTSSNPLARYWHVFNLERKNGVYQVVPVQTIETDFCQVLENMPGTVKCSATGQ